MACCTKNCKSAESYHFAVETLTEKNCPMNTFVLALNRFHPSMFMANDKELRELESKVPGYLSLNTVIQIFLYH